MYRRLINSQRPKQKRSATQHIVAKFSKVPRKKEYKNMQ
jgi:hypothetical protein